MRQIVLDTETTGLDWRNGDRVIEIGCVELLNRSLTGRHFHVYLNPGRGIAAEAVAVHGITEEFLADKPKFVDVAAAQYDEATHQLSCQLALAAMHGRLADGTLLKGIPVFTEAYRRSDLPMLAWIFSRTWLEPFLSAMYYVFAKYRHSISKTIGPMMLRLSKRFA